MVMMAITTSSSIRVKLHIFILFLRNLAWAAANIGSRES